MYCLPFINGLAWIVAASKSVADTEECLGLALNGGASGQGGCLTAVESSVLQHQLVATMAYQAARHLPTVNACVKCKKFLNILKTLIRKGADVSSCKRVNFMYGARSFRRSVAADPRATDSRTKPGRFQSISLTRIANICKRGSRTSLGSTEPALRYFSAN